MPHSLVQEHPADERSTLYYEMVWPPILCSDLRESLFRYVRRDPCVSPVTLRQGMPQKSVEWQI